MTNDNGTHPLVLQGYKARRSIALIIAVFATYHYGPFESVLAIFGLFAVVAAIEIIDNRRLEAESARQRRIQLERECGIDE